jgi:alpha-N-acetylglucosamine transferase
MDNSETLAENLDYKSIKHDEQCLPFARTWVYYTSIKHDEQCLPFARTWVYWESKNGQFRDTSRELEPKGKARMDNSETLAENLSRRG